ncbi:MAG: protein kinase [Planctomycetota bacterium]|nr:protein kinase [Planctomycetota bacterium]
MSDDGFHHLLKTEFDRLLDLPEGDRDAELRRIAETSPDLEAALRSLLSDAPVPEIIRAVESADLGAAGRLRCGPYELVEHLGSGGMGMVYKALQREPIPRTVAVKILALPRPSPRLLARFELEREALARLDHPNIAHVLDAGVNSASLPYIVMEFVDGPPITQYVKRHQSRLDVVLSMFVKVCRAVQHAHDRGVLHRDIKPSNILVAEIDGEPAPKLIDLGVTKIVAGIGPASGPSLQEPMTRAGEVVGTPEYMSPEQADGSEPDIDVRADVYSLGVVLYELLTGSLPVSSETLRRGGSTKIGDAIRSASVTPPSRTRASGGYNDLDAVVLKALRAERELRYLSARDLGDDIERVLRHEPVEARAPSRAYRVRKFIRRNAAVTLAVTLFVPSLAVGLVVALIALMQAQASERAALEANAEALAQRDQARAAQNEAEQFGTYMREALWSTDPSCLGPGATFRQSLARTVDSFLQSPPESRAVQMRVALAVARPLVLTGDHERAHRVLDMAMARVREIGPDHKRGDPAWDQTRLAFSALAELLEAQGQFRQAIEARRASVEAARAYGSPSALAASLTYLAVDLKDSGDFAAAELAQREVIELIDANSAKPLRRTEARLQLLWTLTAAGKFQEAFDLGMPTVDERRSIGMAFDPFLMNIRVETGIAALELGKLDLAESLLREALAFDPALERIQTGSFWAFTQIHRVQARRGEASAAADSLATALTNHPQWTEGVDVPFPCRPVLVQLLADANRLEEARARAQEVCQLAEGAGPAFAAWYHELVGDALGGRVPFDEHAECYERAIKHSAAYFGADSSFAQALLGRATGRLTQRDASKAAAWRDAMQASFRTSSGREGEHPHPRSSP